jgi:hypothetical protein
MVKKKSTSSATTPRGVEEQASNLQELEEVAGEEFEPLLSPPADVLVSLGEPESLGPQMEPFVGEVTSAPTAVPFVPTVPEAPYVAVTEEAVTPTPQAVEVEMERIEIPPPWGIVTSVETWTESVEAPGASLPMELSGSPTGEIPEIPEVGPEGPLSV